MQREETVSDAEPGKPRTTRALEKCEYADRLRGYI
jgi:hypothetical protein